MSEQFGKMAALRLADYYIVAERLGTYSLEGLLTTLGPGSSSQSAPGGAADLGHSSQQSEATEAIMEHSASLEKNAAEASDYWNTL